MYFSRVENDLGQLECVCRREGKCHVPGGWNTGSQANRKIIIYGHGLDLNVV